MLLACFTGTIIYFRLKHPPDYLCTAFTLFQTPKFCTWSRTGMQTCRVSTDQIISSKLLKWCRLSTGGCFSPGTQTPFRGCFCLFLLNAIFMPTLGSVPTNKPAVISDTPSLCREFRFTSFGPPDQIWLSIFRTYNCAPRPPRFASPQEWFSICFKQFAVEFEPRTDFVSLVSIAENSSHGKPPDSKGRVSSLLHKPEFPDADMMEVLIWAEDGISGVSWAYFQAWGCRRCANLKN